MILTMSMISSRSRRMFCNNRKRQYILKGLVNPSVLTTWSMATVNFRRAANSIIRHTVFQGHRYTFMWYLFFFLVLNVHIIMAYFMGLFCVLNFQINMLYSLAVKEKETLQSNKFCVCVAEKYIRMDWINLNLCPVGYCYPNIGSYLNYMIIQAHSIYLVTIS